MGSIRGFLYPREDVSRYCYTTRGTNVIQLIGVRQKKMIEISDDISSTSSLFELKLQSID